MNKFLRKCMAINNKTKKTFLIVTGFIIIIICLKYNFKIFFTFVPPYKFASKWDTGGTGVLTVDSKGYIYIADNSRIKKYNSNGNFITGWKIKDNAPKQSVDITDIYADLNDNIYVVDNGNSSVQKYDNKGRFLCIVFAKYFSSNKGLRRADQIAVDIKGNTFITDSYNCVRKFNSKGNLITRWEVQGNISDITLDSQGNVYVASSKKYIPGIDEDPKGSAYDPDLVRTADKNTTWDSYINKFDSSGRVLYKDLYRLEKKKNAEIGGIALDSYDNIFITERGTASIFGKYRILMFDNKGNFRGKFGSKGSENGQFEYPECIAVDRENNVYISVLFQLDSITYGGKPYIYKFTPKN
jgi:tripartite motif-containing protein 71